MSNKNKITHVAIYNTATFYLSDIEVPIPSLKNSLGKLLVQNDEDNYLKEGSRAIDYLFII